MHASLAKVMSLTASLIRDGFDKILRATPSLDDVKGDAARAAWKQAARGRRVMADAMDLIEDGRGDEVHPGVARSILAAASFMKETHNDPKGPAVALAGKVLDGSTTRWLNSHGAPHETSGPMRFKSPHRVLQHQRPAAASPINELDREIALADAIAVAHQRLAAKPGHVAAAWQAAGLHMSIEDLAAAEWRALPANGRRDLKAHVAKRRAEWLALDRTYKPGK